MQACAAPSHLSYVAKMQLIAVAKKEIPFKSNLEWGQWDGFGGIHTQLGMVAMAPGHLRHRGVSAPLSVADSAVQDSATSFRASSLRLGCRARGVRGLWLWPPRARALSRRCAAPGLTHSQVERKCGSLWRAPDVASPECAQRWDWGGGTELSGLLVVGRCAGT
jgi:hypothetical protein